MGIYFEQERRIIGLNTDHTTYQMQIDENGYLLHLYYGALVGSCPWIICSFIRIAASLPILIICRSAGTFPWIIFLRNIPEVLLGFADQGFTGLSRQYTDFIRRNIVRDRYKDERRPILINNWEATYFDFNTDKLLEIAGQAKELGIEMLVLDMGRTEVQDYLFDCLYKLLSENHIEYVKWDMNRHMADVYSNALPFERQGEVRHRYMLGVYSLLERLTQSFPDVLFEGCSGGGGHLLTPGGSWQCPAPLDTNWT